MIDWTAHLQKALAHPEALPEDPFMAQVVYATCLLYQRYGALVSPTALPTLDDGAMAKARLDLHALGMAPGPREEALALCKHGGTYLDFEHLDLPEDLALEIATHLDPKAMVAVVRVGWNGRSDYAWGEWADLLSLHFEDAKIQGSVISPLVDETMLDPELEGAQRIANEFRYLRLSEVATDPWAMWSKLHKHQKSPGGRLYYTIALPGALDPEIETALGDIDVVLTMEDFSQHRGAQPRRREAVKRIAGILKKGGSVLWMANSTTIESRRAVVAAGREAHAQIHCLFIDRDPHHLKEKLEDEAWLIVPERAYNRALSVFEGPRPHEADRVYCVGEGGVIDETWQNTIYAGWKSRAHGG